MFFTVITDCSDENARMRQLVRLQALFGVFPVFCAVGTDLAAAGNLVDALDAARGAEGVVLVNVAPRHNAVASTNGTPFCYFRVWNTLVVSTLGGATLSLVAKLGLIRTVLVIDPSADDVAGIGDPKSQFRSFDFSPFVAERLLRGHHLDSAKPHALAADAGSEPAVWHVDNFGNCKTTVLEHELDGLEPKLAGLPRHKHLKDAPRGTLSWVVGSSGYRDRRFCELVVRGGHALSELFTRELPLRLPTIDPWS